MRTIKMWIVSMLEIMGTDAANLDWEKLYPFGIDSTTNKPIPKPQQALIRISWRVIYRHLTAVSKDNSFFRPETIISDIARDYMSRILTYQEERSIHYRKNLNSPNTEKLPTKLIEEIDPIGTLNTLDGSITINPKLRDALIARDVWTAHYHGISDEDKNRILLKKRKYGL